MKVLIGAGAAISLAAMLLAGSLFTSAAPAALAGEDECVTFTPTRTATRTPTPGSPTATPSPTNTATPTETTVILTSNEVAGGAVYGSIYDGGVSGSSDSGVSSLGNQTPQATCVATSTPVNTATVVNTPVNTTVPATNTPVGGGGGVVAPPDTGSGDGLAGSGVPMWMLAAGAAVAALGGGAVLAGARRRGR